MAVTWKDFNLNGVERLSASPVDERHYRDAIRCYYYSVFHACSPLIVGQKLDKNKGSHDRVIDALLTYPTTTDNKQSIAKEIGRALGKFKKFRTKADYHLDVDFNKEIFNNAMEYKVQVEYNLKRLNLI